MRGTFMEVPEQIMLIIELSHNFPFFNVTSPYKKEPFPFSIQ